MVPLGMLYARSSISYQIKGMVAGSDNDGIAIDYYSCFHA